MKFKKSRYRVNGIAGDFYYDSSRTSFDGLFLSLIGLPSFPGPNKMIEEVVKYGYIVIQPHYPGTYDSDGELSPSAFYEVFEHLNLLLHTGIPKGGSVIDIPKTNIVLTGHSFGCAALLRGVCKFEYEANAIFFGPAAHYSRESPDYGLIEDGPEHFSKLRLSHPHTYRLAELSEWATIINGKDLPPNHPQTNKIKGAAIVVGENDAYCDKNACKENLPTLIQAYFGSSCKVKWYEVEQAGHPLTDLVSSGNFHICNLLEEFKVGRV
ncbi:hypothetical protein [Pseudoalteromonas sp. XMcav11-Q]|uniref:hypothetical protein n=1 Tax=Pseudoalteromonas sp. XMcav11-Q TaxID=3136665 RepID=UPI0032C45909